jgi:hypothetical protein
VDGAFALNVLRGQLKNYQMGLPAQKPVTALPANAAKLFVFGGFARNRVVYWRLLVAEDNARLPMSFSVML